MTAPAIQTVVETAIYASDLAATKAFYCDQLGLRLLGEDLQRHVFLQVGPSSVLLIFNPLATNQEGDFPKHGATGPGHFALGIQTTDLEAWRQHLVKQAIPIEKELTWPRGGHSLYFRDPAGNLVELMTPGGWGTPSGW